MALALRIVAHSEIGLVRKNNQDSGYASPTMLIVADGMGGAAAGDLASSVAIAELTKVDGRHQGEDMLEVLAGAVHKANDRMADLIADNHGLDGMGTTVCGALFDGTRLGVVHIGDSRGYLRRDDDLERLTHDHSWVQTLVDEGRITEEESLYHPHRSLILKVLNGQPIHEPDLFLVDVQAGDRVMFCSDGLCGLVPDATIDHFLGEPDLTHALHDLIEAAHGGGGLDNITILIADVYDEADPSPVPSGGHVTSPTIVGAAATREIPAVVARPAIRLDADLDDEPNLDAAGNPVPAAPAPVAVAPQPVRTDPEAARYAPHLRRRKRRRTGLLVGILALVVTIIGTGWGTYAYAQTRYYVGSAAAGPGRSEVAIYQGVRGGLPGIPFSHLVERSGVSIADLPPSYAAQVTQTIPITDGIDQARRTVADLKAKAERCVQQRKDKAAATESPSPTPSPTASPTPSTSPTAAPTTSAGSEQPSPNGTPPASGPSVSRTASAGPVGTGTPSAAPPVSSSPATPTTTTAPAPDEC
jgi:protein phosphatase